MEKITVVSPEGVNLLDGEDEVYYNVSRNLFGSGDDPRDWSQAGDDWIEGIEDVEDEGEGEYTIWYEPYEKRMN